MFSTKLVIQLSNCRNNSVYTSDEGKSKIKDLKKGHHDALRKAFESIENLTYAYDESLTQKAVVTNESPSPKPEVKATPKVLEEVTETTKAKADKVEEPVKEKPFKVINKSRKDAKSIELDDTEVLYAQEITNGYQLVDSTPKIVYKLLKTSRKDIYALEGQTGIAYKKGDIWYAEYYKDGVVVVKKLSIKF